MKQKLTAGGVGILLAYLLAFPKEALAASREGMTLWLNTMIPTLLPFIILTGILIHTDGIEKIFSPFSFVWKKLLGLSPRGAYVCFLGLLLGYPMGAKLAADLYGAGKLKKQEAAYLLTFCNNASPAFLTTYLAHICLKDAISLAQILKILILSDILCMLFFRFVVYKNKTVTPDTSLPQKKTSHGSSPGAIIDVSVMNGFETMARLGGYILLFSLSGGMVSHFWRYPPIGKYVLLGFMEVTTGLKLLSASGLSFFWRYLLAMMMTAFGGLCVMAQTKSVLQGRLSLLPYAFSKCMNACLTAFLVFLSLR